MSNSGFWVQCWPLTDGHFCQRIWQPLKTFPLQRAMEYLVPEFQVTPLAKIFFYHHENIGWNFAVCHLVYGLSKEIQQDHVLYKKITALLQGQAFKKSSLLRITKLILEINTVALDLFICTYLPYYNIFSNSMLGFCIFFFRIIVLWMQDTNATSDIYRKINRKEHVTTKVI